MGGGSVIDTAKGINILYSQGGSLLDYEGVNVLTQALGPLVAVPTTAGTGSEVTQYAVIKDEGRHLKLTFISPLPTTINELCNRLGLDTITCGSTIAFAIECFERGLITAEVTGGLELRWSDPDLAIELINQISEQRGFGRLLALGSARMAECLWPEAKECLTTVKGLEAPMHDPRAGFGLGLAYATGYRGACHVSSVTMNVEQGASLYPLLGLAEGIPEGRTGEGKAEMVELTRRLSHVGSGIGPPALSGGQSIPVR